MSREQKREDTEARGVIGVQLYMKKIIISFICIILLLSSCNKKNTLQLIGEMENEAAIDNLTEIQENMDNITHDDIKQMFVGNWICYHDLCAFHSNGKFERYLLESSYYASGYWEVNDDKFIIAINFRSEEYREWDLYHKEVYKYSFIDDDTLVLTIVEGNDIMVQKGIIERIFIRLDGNKDIFGEYRIHADYVFESFRNYIKRFGWR